MGGCVSVDPDEREAKQRSAAIERQLRSDAREYENTIKILLLGELPSYSHSSLSIVVCIRTTTIAIPFFFDVCLI